MSYPALLKRCTSAQFNPLCSFHVAKKVEHNKTKATSENNDDGTSLLRTAVVVAAVERHSGPWKVSPITTDILQPCDVGWGEFRRLKQPALQDRD